jgi:hypothetical protein
MKLTRFLSVPLIEQLFLSLQIWIFFQRGNKKFPDSSDRTVIRHNKFQSQIEEIDV